MLRRTWVARRLFPLRKKTLADGGKMFALVGADGSGKSTLVGDLHRWLSWKVDTRTAYFGKQRAIAFGIPMKTANVLARLEKLHFGGAYSQMMANLRERTEAVTWLLAARRKYRLSRHCSRFAARGGVVITDRYPLPVFDATVQPMDGPRIRRRYGHRFSHLARCEDASYSRLARPDRAFILATTAERLLARKNTERPDRVKEKAEAVNSITSNEYIRSVDGNRPYDDVLRSIKILIWEALL